MDNLDIEQEEIQRQEKANIEKVDTELFSQQYSQNQKINMIDSV